MVHYSESFIENGRKKSIPLSSGRPGSRVVWTGEEFYSNNRKQRCFSTRTMGHRLPESFVEGLSRPLVIGFATSTECLSPRLTNYRVLSPIKRVPLCVGIIFNKGWDSVGVKKREAAGWTGEDGRPWRTAYSCDNKSPPTRYRTLLYCPPKRQHHAELRREVANHATNQRVHTYSAPRRRLSQT